MRHSRRNGHSGHEFGGSGEDSFVAVVVTKLTGALLFILLLTMVIMALLPKAVDLPATANRGEGGDESLPELAIATPERLPEAIAGRPYTLALAATGARGPLRWSISGTLPEGLTLDPASGVVEGSARKGTAAPVELVLRVSDGQGQATRSTTLLVYQSDQPLTTPAWWKPGIPPIPWKTWLEQGFGFLLIALTHALGMSTLAGSRRWSEARLASEPDRVESLQAALARRFAVYRATVRLASLSAATALGTWLWLNQTHGHPGI